MRSKLLCLLWMPAWLVGCITWTEPPRVPTPEDIPPDMAVFRGYNTLELAIWLHAANGERYRAPRGFGRMADHWVVFLPADTAVVDLFFDLNIPQRSQVLEGVEVEFTGGHGYVVKVKQGSGFPWAPPGAYYVWIEDEKTGEVVTEKIASWPVDEQKN